MAQTDKQHEWWMARRAKRGRYPSDIEVPEHYVWRSMRARCHNPNNKAYSSYGGRGITVCDRWNDYTAFLQDMGERPSPDHSIERIDNDKGYEPGNCKWATRGEQGRNTRRTQLYTNGTFIGVLTDCAAHLGISKELAHYRFKQHGTFEKGAAWHKHQSMR